MHALAELLLFGLTPLIFGGLIMPQSLAAEEVTIAGEVSYRERIALPPGAVLTVQLIDVSEAGAAAPVVAKETVRVVHQSPISFEMRFDESKLQSGKAYGIQAQISVGGKVWFANSTYAPFEPAKQQIVMLSRSEA